LICKLQAGRVTVLYGINNDYSELEGSMTVSRAIVLGSWVLTSATISAAIFATPYMQKVWRGEAVESLAASLAAIAIGAVICGWPWALALGLKPSQGHRQRVFSGLAIALAVAFYFPIATGQDFSIGLNIIFCVLSIWVAYPITRLVPSNAAF
jgi:hypothetical protein